MHHIFLHGCAGSDQPAPLAIDFDAATAALSQLPRMFLEQDGSFVWRPDPQSDCQLDGVIYDVGDRVQYVEMKGSLTVDQWLVVFNRLRRDDESLTIQVARKAVFLSEAQFLQGNGFIDCAE